MKEISIVIPVYNSSENLFELHRQIQDSLKALSFEIIFVDDYSTDNSWAVIKTLSAENNNVIAVRFRKNFGQDNALMAGFSFAKGKYTVIMDDDLQHSPYDIQKLYLKCKEGYDICYARFFVKNQKIWKKYGSKINSIMALLLFGKPNGLYMSPFKVVKSEIIKEIILYNGPMPYVDGLLLEVTRNFSTATIEHHPRYKGISNYNFFKSLAVFLKVMTGFSVVPLRLATIIGFTTSIIGFITAVYFLIKYFVINETVEGWTSLIITLLIVGGLILMFLGLTGEYLGRMFITLNKKPQYSIDEISIKDDN